METTWAVARYREARDKYDQAKENVKQMLQVLDKAERKLGEARTEYEETLSRYPGRMFRQEIERWLSSRG